jgi:4-amino-4-deoxy-L-arabinose transferase-like glycosyltransferase
MPHIQELIYQLEVGSGPRIIRIIATSLAVLALAWWYDTREFKNFNTAEAMETAQLARNLAEGRGYTTECIRPLSLYLVQEKRGLEFGLGKTPHPDLMTPPVYPLFLAGLMKVLPFDYEINGPFWEYQPEVIIAIANQILFLLTIGLICGLASRLFNLEVAVFTLAFLLVSDVLWHFSTAGLSTMLVMFWVTLLARVMLRLVEACHEGGGPRSVVGRWALLVGLIIGVEGLTRYSMLGLLVPVILFAWIFCARRAALITTLVVVGAALVAGPWLARNYSWSGRPFGLAGFALESGTLPYPGNTLERSLHPNLEEVGLNDYLRKGVVNLHRSISEDLPVLGGNWLGGFFLVGLLLRYRNPGLSRLRFFALLTLGTLMVAQAIGRTHLSEDMPTINSENLLILLAPLLVMFGAGFLSTLLDQLELPIPELRHFLTVVLVGMAATPMLLTFLPPRNVPINYPPYYPPWIQTNAKLLNEDELMMSDMPWAVAWYGNRQCVWIPRNPREAFFEIHDRHKQVSALYLTQLTSNAKFLSQIIQGRDYDWARFVMAVLVLKELPEDFPLVHGWGRYLPDQLFLCDRPRWEDKRLKQPGRPTPPVVPTEPSILPPVQPSLPAPRSPR